MTEMKSPLFKEQYQNRTRGLTKGDECSLCGRRTAGGPNTKWVHYLTSGQITTEREHVDTQGYFAIGSECAKTLPKTFVFVNTNGDKR